MTVAASENMPEKEAEELDLAHNETDGVQEEGAGISWAIVRACRRSLRGGQFFILGEK